ncbi:MAG: GAF domain-containing protein [Anaerolineaceae bacterium]|nr:GAF domain-containing protein [Anaerolineaceae bacterium]
MPNSLPDILTIDQDKLETWIKTSTAVNQANQPAEILKILLDYGIRALKADLGGIYLSQGSQLNYFDCNRHEQLPPRFLTPHNDPVFFELLQAKTVPSLTLANDFDPSSILWNYFQNQQIQSVLVIQLRANDRAIGLLFLGDRAIHPIMQDDLRLLTVLADSASSTLYHLQSIDQLSQKITNRELELKVICEIVAIASEAQDSEALLNESLSAALQATNCQIGVIHLIDAATQRLNMAACHQFEDKFHNWLELSGIAQELWRRTYDQQTLVQVQDLRTQSYTELTGPNVFLLNYLGAPIRVKDRKLGVLSIFGEDNKLLSPGMTDLVCTISDQIGLALESNRLHKHVEENLVLKERQRLARDLHDSISQSLYGLVLAADASRKLLQIQEFDELEKILANIDKASRQSLKEMRLMLFELRPLSLETEGLVKAIELRLNTVERRAGVEIELDINEAEKLPTLLEIEIYRIVTEALNNSLKHAEASHVSISFQVQTDQVTVEIADDGKGFDLTTPSNGGMGLLSMAERTVKISGDLKIDSAPGQGTHIWLNAPLRKQCK